MFLIIATVVIGVFLGGCVSLIFGQSRLVFMPPKPSGWTPGQAGLEYEDVTLSPVAGETINAWFIPVKDARGTIICAHGNGEDLSSLGDYIEFYTRFGVNVLAFDYRGYGRSTGKPSEKATYEDIAAIWKYLTETRGIPPAQIVIWGRSLGGAVAAQLACDLSVKSTAQSPLPAGLILESTFTSIPDIGAHHFPWLPVRLIARIHYDTKKIISSIACPILITHSPEDEVIPYSHGRRLFELAHEPKYFAEMEAGHNDSPWQKGSGFRDAVDEFLDGCLSKPPE